ncbi:hypothetical protein HK101_005483 [Irineochytrium annulatum]|nr:hypothetical protein HK101_005483 [Irineochytrium annulatum]
MILSTLVVAASLVTAVFALAPNEPPDGKASNFQLVQTIPVSMDFGVKNVANLTLLSEGTDASVFITIYPNTGNGTGIDMIQQSDYDDLASQVRGIINSTGRAVFIRYAPEMNGAWMIYHNAGTAAFFASWQAMVNTVRAMNPEKVAFVWSPNIAVGADAYATWYPGDAYVDWVGLSIYWKGAYENYPWISNTVADPLFFSHTLDGFYQTYAVGANKPFVMAEGGGTYHLNYSTNHVDYTPCGGDLNQSEVIMSFWNTFLFNPAFYTAYPKAKMFNMFEFIKEEHDVGTWIWRDFRATIDPTTLAAFKAQLAIFDAKGLFQWANKVTLPQTSTAAATATATPSRSPGGGSLTASVAISTAAASWTATTTKSGGGATSSVSSAMTAAMGLFVVTAVLLF